MPDLCAYIYRHGYPHCPDEFCDEEAAEGQDYCAEHGRLADG